MTPERRGGPARTTGNDSTGKDSKRIRDDAGILQFSPAYSVYLLPPDSVCVYSEHRKFFLHGELYCALATAIGSGASHAGLLRTLQRSYPVDSVKDAIKRLLDRRFLVSGSGSPTTTVDAFWASLGVPADVAKSNLEKTRVRLQSLDVEGTDAIADALGELGVRIAKRTGEITVTLVSDYLEPRLAELNRQHLGSNTPWFLAQPSGIFPLVGPVFRPGAGPCWSCLSERMQRNREIKAFLDRTNAKCVATSPLARRPFGEAAISLTATEIAKAIATGFRTDLTDHIVSLDLMGSTIARHYVARRPQCASCGRPELRDPSRKPAPLEVGAGSRLVMTSGGYRAVAPSATVARFRKHVSPLTGVVSRLERIEADIPLNTNFLAVHNFSTLPETVADLKQGLGGSSYGKGSTAEQGEASALMEAIERYSGIYQGDEIRVKRRLTDFPAGDAIAPNDILLFSDAQRRQMSGPVHDHGHGHADASPTTNAFERTTEIEWSPAWSLRDGRFKYVPTSIAYFSYRDAVGNRASADSNGCAAGNSLEEAIVQGFLELVERDSYAIWWYNRLLRAEVDLDHFDDPYIRDLRVRLGETGRRLSVLDITSDLGIPSYVALAHWSQDGQQQIEFGSGAHFDARIAMLRALTELNQFLSIAQMGGDGGANSTLEPSVPFDLEAHPYLIPKGRPVAPSDAGARFADFDKRSQVMACVDLVARAGLDFIVLDQTRPDIEVPVVRVIVPGLRHFYRRFAPGRLYDIPVKLGLLKKPRAEAELNPILPKT